MLRERNLRRSDAVCLIMLHVQDDELGTKVPDGDLEGLAAQNTYLQEALETCRRDIASMSQQAGLRPFFPKPN